MEKKETGGVDAEFQGIGRRPKKEKSIGRKGWN